MSAVKLEKRWCNHNKGTVLQSVSPGILNELVKGGFAKRPEKPEKRKAVSTPPSNKAVGVSPSTK